MAVRICLLTLLMFTSPLVSFAQSPSTLAPASTTHPFLECKRAYVIRFATSQDPFQHKMSGITEAYTLGPNGEKKDVQPMPYSASVRLDIFRVVRFGGGGWVLMEYPASSKDYASWGGKHRAMIMLSAKTPAPENDPEEQDRLTRLREAAAKEIRTTQTWVNLDHAITITEVSSESLGLETDN